MVFVHEKRRTTISISRLTGISSAIWLFLEEPISRGESSAKEVELLKRQLQLLVVFTSLGSSPRSLGSIAVTYCVQYCLIRRWRLSFFPTDKTA